MKIKVYIETSVVSYLTAQPSRDVVALGRQEVTRRSWKTRRQGFSLVEFPAYRQRANAPQD